jgi:hypothetical protein
MRFSALRARWHPRMPVRASGSTMHLTRTAMQHESAKSGDFLQPILGSIVKSAPIMASVEAGQLEVVGRGRPLKEKRAAPPTVSVD